jgi:hypothetical protein
MARFGGPLVLCKRLSDRLSCADPKRRHRFALPPHSKLLFLAIAWQTHLVAKKVEQQQRADTAAGATSVA